MVSSSEDFSPLLPLFFSTQNVSTFMFLVHFPSLVWDPRATLNFLFVSRALMLRSIFFAPSPPDGLPLQVPTVLINNFRRLQEVLSALVIGTLVLHPGAVFGHAANLLAVVVGDGVTCG